MKNFQATNAFGTFSYTLHATRHPGEYAKSYKRDNKSASS